MIIKVLILGLIDGLLLFLIHGELVSYILWLQIFAKLVWYFFQKYLCFAWIRREDLWWGIYTEYASYLWGQNTCLLRGAMNNLRRIKDWGSMHALKLNPLWVLMLTIGWLFISLQDFPGFSVPCGLIDHALHFSKCEVPHTSSILLVKKTSCGNHITRKHRL